MDATRRTQRTSAFVILAAPAFALLLALAGCTREPEAVLRIGTNVWIGSEPLYLARELGRLDPKAVQLVEYPSASEVLRAFRNQAIDGMVIEPGDLILGDDDGLLSVPFDAVEAVHAAATQKAAAEARQIASIEAGTHDAAWVDASLRRLGCAGLA